MSEIKRFKVNDLNLDDHIVDVILRHGSFVLGLREFRVFVGDVANQDRDCSRSQTGFTATISGRNDDSMDLLRPAKKANQNALTGSYTGH